jgi:hypothetical protein
MVFWDSRQENSTCSPIWGKRSRLSRGTRSRNFGQDMILRGHAYGGLKTYHRGFRSSGQWKSKIFIHLKRNLEIEKVFRQVCHILFQRQPLEAFCGDIVCTENAFLIENLCSWLTIRLTWRADRRREEPKLLHPSSAWAEGTEQQYRFGHSAWAKCPLTRKAKQARFRHLWEPLCPINVKGDAVQWQLKTKEWVDLTLLIARALFLTPTVHC